MVEGLPLDLISECRLFLLLSLNLSHLVGVVEPGHLFPLFVLFFFLGLNELLIFIPKAFVSWSHSNGFLEVFLCIIKLI